MSTVLSNIRDNHTRGTVADFLRAKIHDNSHLSVVSAYFTIYAYDALKETLDRIEHLDFLFGEPTFVNRLDPSKTEKKAFIIDAAGLELANKLQQKRVAKECAEWIERKVDIIQRFGRIDRIGSASHTVQLVNFWPTEDLNKYINLKNRVEARMALVDIAATFEDNVLKNDEIEDIVSEDLRYRDKQLLRLKDEVLDLEDLGDSVSLTEFTLDDFRLELLKYIEANRAALEAAPFGLYTCVPPHPDYKVIHPGVIFCFRQEQRGADIPVCASGAARPTGMSASQSQINPLQPYFLVYVLADGSVRFGFANPKQILDIYRILCSGKGEANTQLCNLFDQQTGHGSDMKDYDKLLQKAVASVAATFRKRAASGLQSARGFILPDEQDQVHEKTDLELVTWLVIKEVGNV